MPVRKNKDEEHEEEHESEEEEEEEEDKTFTQEDVDKLIRRRVGETKRKAVSAVLEELGVDDVEAAKAAIAKANKPAPKKKGESSKEGEGEEAKEEIDVESIRKEIKKEFQAQLDEVTLTNEIEALIADRYETTMKAAKKLRKLVEVETDAEEDDIITALEDLEEDMPDLFKKKDEEEEEETPGLRQERRSRNSNPARSPRSPRGKGKDTRSAARTLLHERHPQTRKST